MTDPIDASERESEPGQAPVPPATPADSAESAPATPWGAPRGDPPSGWVAPKEGTGGGGRARGCVIALLVVAVLVLVGLLALIFLGSQMASSLAGTMEFGTGGTGCLVTGNATAFPSSTAIHSAAYLERGTREGETITTIVTYPNGASESNERTFDATGICITEDVEPGLDPGHYVIEYRSGTEVLAKGEFDITP